MNTKKGKSIFIFWTNEEQTKFMEEAIQDKDSDKACLIFLESFKEGMCEKR